MNWVTYLSLAIQIIKLIKELDKGKDADVAGISKLATSALPPKATKNLTPEEREALPGLIADTINLFLKDN